jgi:hypothetical protein
MTLPRMSLDSLLARLQTERKAAFAIVEGFSDRRVLTSWSEREGLAVDFYCADEIDIELDDRFRPYGGNKGRVFTIFSCREIAEFSGSKAIGIVDTDLDNLLGRKLDIPGIYYTEYSCLFSQLLSPERLRIFLSEVFHNSDTNEFIDELCRTSRMIFRLRAEKQRHSPMASLPSFRRYIARGAARGFDWDGYLDAALPRFSGSISKAAILQAISEVGAADVRHEIHLHSTIEIMWGTGRRVGIFDNTVSIEEIYRHLRVFYLRICSDCGTAALVRNMVLRLS